MNCDIPNFKTSQEEILYWRLKAQEYFQLSEDARHELEEYQESSREVEQELETQLKQAENQVRELRSSNNRLHLEHSSLKTKFESLSREHHSQVGELESQVKELRAKAEELVKKVRQLEQTNDDLERANRATLGSLEDFEARLHQAIERNAFLESELDDKETLAVMVQRLKDETKELKQELHVRQRAIHDTPDNDKIVKDDSGKSREEIEEQEKSDPTKSPSSNGMDSNKLPNGTTHLKSPTVDNGITQAARHSALNIVGDLLRRVGALEHKLSTCRTMVQDKNGTNKETTRTKLLTRGSSTSKVQSIIRA